MSSETQLPTFMELSNLTAQYLSQLDEILYPVCRESSIPEVCEYCIAFERECFYMEREKEKEYATLVREVERVLHLAATAIAKEEKPTSVQSSGKAEESVARKDLTDRSSHKCTVPTISSVKKLEYPLRRSTKPRYIPAHLKAPYKTESCKTKKTSKVCPMHVYHNQASTISTIRPVAICPEVNSFVFPHEQSNETKKQSKTRAVVAPNFADFPKDYKTVETTPSLPANRNPRCACKIKIISKLENELNKSIQHLQCVMRQHVHLAEFKNIEKHGKAFCLHCFGGGGRRGLENFMRFACSKLANFSDEFRQHLMQIDPNESDSSQREWIQSMAVRMLKLHHVLRSLCSSAPHEPSNYSDSAIGTASAPDDVSQWIETNRTQIPSSFDNPILRSYLILGPVPSGFTRSRLSALSITPGLCVFNGSAQDQTRFLKLWSEAESVNLDTKLLAAFQRQLPALKTELDNHTEHRASKYRELYGLICGASPVALKDKFAYESMNV